MEVNVISTTIILAIITLSTSAPLPKYNSSMELYGSDSGEVWWHNPCKAQPLRPFRHKEKCNTVLPKRALHQIKIMLGMFKEKKSDIDKFYKERNCVQLKKEQYNYDWLPKIPTKNHYGKDLVKAYRDFHRDIQIFAVAFYQLRRLNVDTQVGFNINHRADIFSTISAYTKNVMCEVETAFKQRCPDQFERIPEDYLDNKIWLKSTDLTEMCIQDRGVLTAYTEFIKKWKGLFVKLRGKGKRNGNDQQKHKRTRGGRRKNNNTKPVNTNNKTQV